MLLRLYNNVQVHIMHFDLRRNFTQDLNLDLVGVIAAAVVHAVDLELFLEILGEHELVVRKGEGFLIALCRRFD